MTKKKFNVGDVVKVIDQDIFGTILRIHLDTNEIVIKDHHSEYDFPDDQLVYRDSEINNFFMIPLWARR